ALLFPFAAGAGLLFDPLVRRRRGAAPDGTDADEFLRVGPLDLLPADGTPRLFVLTADRNDAWTRLQNDRVGTVYLSRDDSSGAPRVTAFTALCPHLGCGVDYDAAAKKFACPCHEAAFAVDGSRVSGPSMRGLDELAVELRPGANGTQDIFVAYKTFLPGIAERTPIS
ncbi:MAG: Rieske 2Fe-2S domain-containing protein, partial [Pirellulales bacterium]